MKSGSLNISGMPYRRSGHAGGKSVSMISMLVLLMAALLVLPSCFDDDDEVSCGTGTVEQNGVCVEVDTTTCGAGTEKNADGMCVASNPLECGTGTIANSDGMCVPNIAECGTGTMLNAGVCEEVDTTTLDSACGEGTTQDADSNMCVPVIVACGTGTTSNADGECVLDTGACADGTILNAETGQCETDYDEVAEGTCTNDKEDRHMGGNAGNKIMGTSGNDCIDGEEGNDSIKGLAGNDDIAGGPGNDTISGGDGNDKLYGNAGDDTIEGGGGDDELTGGDGDNTLNGGAGKDIAIYKDSTRVKVSLKDGTATNITMPTDADNSFTLGGGVDELIGIEDVKGSHGNDIIDGDGNANLLKGLDGADTINGHGGDDTIIPNRPMPPAPNADGNGLAAGETTPMDGIDTIDGGEGVDTVSYEGEQSVSAVSIIARALVVDLSDEPVADSLDTSNIDESKPPHIKATLGGDAGVTDKIIVENKGTEDKQNWVSTIENVIGGGGSDEITGDERDNELTGGGGDDTLNGGKGNDTIHADNDDMNLDGGTGLLPEDDKSTTDVDESVAGDMDTLSYAGIKEDTDGNTTGKQGATNKTIVNDIETSGIRGFEVVIGSDLNDSFTAPGEGGVTIMGGGGDDALTGAEGKDTLMGDSGNDTLMGAAGVDTLNGGPGKDMLTGNDGADIFVVFSGESSGDNADTITDYAPDVADGEGQITTAGDEIHLKNFSSQTAVVEIENDTNVTVSVGGTVVLNVTADNAADAIAISADLRKEGKIKFVTTN